MKDLKDLTADELAYAITEWDSTTAKFPEVEELIRRAKVAEDLKNKFIEADKNPNAHWSDYEWFGILEEAFGQGERRWIIS